MNIVPFQHGDAAPREIALQHARAEAKKQDGVRKQLYDLEASIGEELPPVDCPLQHVFAPGVYARTIFIPAGTVVVGKIHKHQHLNILSQGCVSVMTEGGGAEQFQGPLTMVSPAGCKRAVYAHTDVTWTTVHLVQSTDLAEIEAEVIAPTFEDYEQFRLQGETMNQIEVQA
jgi:hypothetical protein